MIPSLKKFSTWKCRGELVEMHFMTRAATHGFTVSKPWGDSARYDFILEHEGGLCRVQVKSTTKGPKPPKRGYICTVVSQTKAHTIKPYSRKEIDFIAAYVIPKDAWFILPVELIRGRSAVWLDPIRPRGKYAPYLEAWHLLRAAAAPRRTP
jgi:hypothetical protein